MVVASLVNAWNACMTFMSVGPDAVPNGDGTLPHSACLVRLDCSERLVCTVLQCGPACIGRKRVKPRGDKVVSTGGQVHRGVLLLIDRTTSLAHVGLVF